MAETIDLDAVVEKLYGFSPLRRVLLATAGTLQGTLSAFFGAPVTIELVHQEESDGFLLREVDLVCATGPVVVCHAVSEARVTDPEVRRLMLEGKVGLGQISAMLGVPTWFALEEVGQNTGRFWRVYRLWGDGFSLRIREVFPEVLYGDGM